jgi:hypothetical protein
MWTNSEFANLLADSIKHRPGRVVSPGVLDAGLSASRQFNQIMQRDNFQIEGFAITDLQLEGNLLASVNRNDDAIAALQRAGIGAPKEIVDALDKRIMEIRKGK